jgi:hypothetical protein
MSSNPHLWNYKPPPETPKPGELLFEFLLGHDRFLCELRDHGKYGLEAQFFQNEEFLYSRRLDTRALAEHWANEMRSDIERDGLPPDEPA